MSEKNVNKKPCPFQVIQNYFIIFRANQQRIFNDFQNDKEF